MTQPNECSGGPLRPTSAERVKTLLVAADSLTVTTDEHRCELVGLHSLDAVGRLLLWAPARSCLVSEILAAAGGDVEALVEVTDVAATAVRDRVRARVTVHGWLSLNHADASYGTAELGLDLRRAELDEYGFVSSVPPEALTAAEVDPLAAAEPEMLLHLADAHADAVALLTRLVDPVVLQGATGVWPLALDRYGVVLRVQRRSDHRDVRLPFARRARDVHEAQFAVNALLVEAGRARRCRSAGAWPR